MNGSLGNVLACFPEGKTQVQYFAMEALTGGGYGPRTDVRLLSGVLQCAPGRRVGTKNRNLVLERGCKYWSDEKLEVGRFIDDGEFVYRIGMPDDDWTDYSEMVIYDCERLVGDDGTPTVQPAFSQIGGGVTA